MSSILALTALFVVAHAAVVPTGPAPGQVFTEGGNCEIQWNVDTTGSWTNLEVQLMTGDNFSMVPLTTIFSGHDGTVAPGDFTYPCPSVKPNAPIYFYQFTNGGSDPTWTGRFTIAATDGSVTAPPNATQPDGSAIPWGTGRLIGAASTTTTTTSDGSATTTISGSGSLVTSVTSSKAGQTTTSGSSNATFTTTGSGSPYGVGNATSTGTSASSSSTATSSGSDNSTSAGGSSGAEGVRLGRAGLMTALGLVVLGGFSLA